MSTRWLIVLMFTYFMYFEVVFKKKKRLYSIVFKLTWLYKGKLLWMQLYYLLFAWRLLMLLKIGVRGLQTCILHRSLLCLFVVVVVVRSFNATRHYRGCGDCYVHVFVQHCFHGSPMHTCNPSLFWLESLIFTDSGFSKDPKSIKRIWTAREGSG